MAVIERVADGLRIPGRMLGLAARDWESPEPPHQASTGAELWIPSPIDDFTDPEFIVTLVEGQLPQLYAGANFFGARQTIPSVLHQAQSVRNTLDTINGATREAMLRVGSRIAEFLGWLYQDLGDFQASAYWSDRSMEWAQEAADDSMQSYVLFRKANQATAQCSAQKAVGLARAAQRIPGITPRITALAAQQEAQGHALMGDTKAALAKFDEAQSLACEPNVTRPEATLDTSYCTPTYIEIQRANCWIDLGEPMRAAELFQTELATLPQDYRNDRGVYLARLARAYAKADEPERAADVATKALAIVNQTGSARTMGELATVAQAVEHRMSAPRVAEFTERYRATHDRFQVGQVRGTERC